MIEMTSSLIKKGFAYENKNHVFFAVSKFKDYGKLSNKNLDELKAGSRIEISDLKKNPMDFVLWKPSNEKDPGWESPWGRGRPGWHLECSAMSEKYLGQNLDIHGGGDGGLDVLRGDGGPLGQVRLVPRGVAAEGPGRERVRVEGGRHGGGGATGGDGAGAAAGDGAESRGREGQSRGRERRADGHLWVARGGVVGGGGSGGIARQPVDVSQRSASLDEVLLSDDMCVLHSRVRISFRSRLPSASSPSTLRSLRARGRWRRSCARGGW